MKLETFFEKFDQFADAPNAVAKMRELVLHLAFSGKLLPAPEPWPLKPLKSLATKIGSGATPAGGRESYFTQGIPLIRSMNVHFSGFEPKGLVFLSDEQAKQLANVSVQPGDVLLNITGASIGRVTTAPQEMAGARVNQHVAIIRPIKELDTQFLAKFLVSPEIQRMIDDVQVGATREALTKGLIEQFEIPIPPLTEQKRIVAKVDELMALCDRLEAQQQEREEQASQLARASLARFADAPTPANLEYLFHSSFIISPSSLRKSILTLAVQGKLVPQDPNDEPADELLVTVERDKAQLVRAGVAKPFKHLLPVQANEVPHELPPSWIWVRTETICEAIVDCPHSTPVFIPSGIVCLDTNCFKEGQLIPHKIRFVSEETYTDRVRRLVPRSGDIVFAREGSVGASVIVPQNMRCCLGQRVMLFRLMSDISPRFFSMALSEASSLERLLALHKGIGAKHVNVADMRNALIPLPPLAEQRRIVAKVEQLMALVDALETQLAASRATAANLLSALVSELTAV
jgi:type I restriction enzyme S subunit